MKKLLFLLVAACGTTAVNAQNSHGDSLLSRWVIDVNLLGGLAGQTFTTANTTADYPNALNVNTGKLNYENGYSYGADAQLGFFWGHKRHFGVGTGIMFMQQQGDAVLNNYHVEYEATDGSGNIYRQVVSGHDINEHITTSGFSIPVVLKYKNRFSKHWGFTADAGALINVQTMNAYNTHASFDYEAIYKLIPNADGGTTSAYDNSPIPSSNDWMITKAEFLKNNPNGNVQDYFAAKRALGYNVGDGLTPAHRTGSTSYTAGTVGFLIQPSFNYFLSDNVALNMGLYYMFQPFKNDAQRGYRLADGPGNYSSVMNNVTASTDQQYGVNLGVRFFLGRKRTPLVIASVNPVPPSQCGLCDGSISLAGLFPNQPVTVNYTMNGVAATPYVSTVQPDGGVKVPNLCAGSYTGIVASIKKQNATTQPVVIADPAMSISGQKTTNPTLAGACDGSVIFKGLYPGRSVTINYKLNGNDQPSFTNIIDSSRSITINNLCEGKYTGIVASIGKCTANGTDFTLAAPTPPPPPPLPAPTPITLTIEGTGISTPILFDVNKTTIHQSSIPVIDKAVEELKANIYINIIVDGHADASGPEPANIILSKERAEAVKTALIKRGINSRRIRTRGHGSSIPAATNNTVEGKHQNRRAVMTKSGK